MQQTNSIIEAINILFIFLMGHYPIKYFLYIELAKYYNLILPI